MKNIIIQVIAIIIALIVGLKLLSIIKTSNKEKRISDFSLSKKDFDSTTFFEKISHFIWKLVHVFSNFVGRNRFFIKKSTKYEKYILVKEEKYKSSIDYITVKILTFIAFLLIFWLLVFLEIIPFNIILFILFLLIGFYLPNIMWSISYIKKCNDIKINLYESIIIISDNLEKTNIYNAINRVIDQLDDNIADEYQRILIDLSYNISISQAFKRFYERTKLKEIEIIYNLLNIEQEDLKDTFKLIRKQFNYYDKKDNNIKISKFILNVLKISYIVLPIIIVSLIFIMDNSYLEVLIDDIYGIAVLQLLLLIYVFLLFIIHLIGGKNYE